MIYQFLVCEICEIFSAIYVGVVFDLSYGLRIFAYFYKLSEKCLFMGYECGECLLYAKMLNFAYFRILRID